MVPVILLRRTSDLSPIPHLRSPSSTANQVATNEANLNSADEVQTDGQKHSQHKRGGSTPVALEQTTKIFIETLKCVLTAQLPLSEYLFLVTDSYAAEQTHTHTNMCILKHTKQSIIYKHSIPTFALCLNKFFLHRNYRCVVSHGC